MKLFHFTSRHHVQDVLRIGLTKGVIVTGDTLLNPGFIYGYQWFTANPAPEQSWNEGSSLPYDRCEYRLTVNVPDIYECNILNWLEGGRSLSTFYDIANSYGDPENWRLYKGVIPPGWIKRVDRFKRRWPR